MTLKSLGIATYGLLKRGVKKALHIAVQGLLRTDDVDKPLPKPVQGGFVKPDGPYRNPITTNNNNLVVIMLETDLI